MNSGKRELLSLVLYALSYPPLSNGFLQLQGHTEVPPQNQRNTSTKIWMWERDSRTAVERVGPEGIERDWDVSH